MMTFRARILTKRTTFLTWLFIALSSSAYSQPLHWLVQKGKQEFLILGTVHVGSDTLYPLPERIEPYLRESDGLILEADLSKQRVVLPTANKGDFVVNLLSDSQLQQLETAAKTLGIPSSRLKQQPPWVVALTLQQVQFSQLGYEPALGVEKVLTQKAQVNKVPVFGLETMQFQIDLLGQQPDNGKQMLLDTLSEWPHAQSNANCLIQSWKSGDKDNLEQLLQTENMNEEFADQFIYSRNRQWVDTLLTKASFSEGKFLVAVGTLHLVGSDNMISLLEKQGFTVESLQISTKSGCEFMEP
jgi:uncharacterized protein YbaP (TraB family)